MIIIPCPIELQYSRLRLFYSGRDVRIDVFAPSSTPSIVLLCKIRQLTVILGSDCNQKERLRANCVAVFETDWQSILTADPNLLNSVLSTITSFLPYSILFYSSLLNPSRMSLLAARLRSRVNLSTAAKRVISSTPSTATTTSTPTLSSSRSSSIVQSRQLSSSSLGTSQNASDRVSYIPPPCHPDFLSSFLQPNPHPDSLPTLSFSSRKPSLDYSTPWLLVRKWNVIYASFQPQTSLQS